MLTRSQAVAAFLKVRTYKDLSEMYGINMECQVNVAQDGGERVEGEYHGRQWHAWTDGLTTWKSFRIPINANTEPEYEDSLMRYDLDQHAEGIGMTGWDWQARCSRWVAFDFDAITGHSDKHSQKMTENEIEEVKNAALSIPWVTARKSTGGRGLHLYVFLEPISTNNHTEHSALARSILGKMSALAGFDFKSRVDICGHNMWVWHRKMAGTDGLTLIKQGEALHNSEIPANWKEHIKVVNGSRKRIIPKKIEESSVTDEEQMFLDLISQRVKTPLDDQHKKLLKYLLEDNKTMSWWDADNHMLVTHTFHLKEAHKQLGLRGVFDTLAEGKERGQDINCFGGSTRIITREGVKSLKELVDKEVEVYTYTGHNYAWIKAKIKSFGVQETYPVHFGDNSIVWATKNHQWLYRDAVSGKIDLHFKKYTFELDSKTQLPLAPFDLPEVDWEGYAHGFVYGDGWQAGKKGKRVTTEVGLFKNDLALISLLTKYGRLSYKWYDSIEGKRYYDTMIGLPPHWKQLPPDCTKGYALGFILGLIAADGFVNTSVIIAQKNFQVCERIVDLATYAGLRAKPIKEYIASSSYANTACDYCVIRLSTYNLNQSHFLREDHKAKLNILSKCICTTVSHIGWDRPVKEEVFCAVVPKYHNFTLENHVITSNCFSYPNRRGAWTVRRYTPGVQEHPTWTQDGQGWTRCFYNQEPDLGSASRSNGGIEHPSGGFIFRETALAVSAAQQLGVTVDVADYALPREAKLKHHKDGRLVIEVERKEQDTADKMQGWLPEKGKWTRIYSIQQAPPSELEHASYDDLVRHVTTEGGSDYGWVLKACEGWKIEPLIHVRAALKSLGLNAKDAEGVVGASVMKGWKLVNRPFEPEYCGDREWNRDACKFKYIPTTYNENLNYPTWNRLLNHCGKGLDQVIEENGWCKVNGLKTGADYLKVWLASLFKEPTEPLPYLFFYGDQNSGKSIFHEAISLLISCGVVRADNALISSNGFNAELRAAVLCVVEETDLRNNKTANNRIKDWVTARYLPIHEKGQTPILVVNTTHWVQCDNDHQACPIFPGDTRITMIHVQSLDITEMIPKKQFLPMLEKEASDFLAEIMNLEIPPSNDRLNVPIINTQEKMSAEKGNRTLLETFLEEKCYYHPGEMIKYSDFYAQFELYAGNESLKWTQIRVGRELPPKFPKGRVDSEGSQWFIGNVSWSLPPEGAEKGPRLIVINSGNNVKLVLEKIFAKVDSNELIETNSAITS